MIGVLQAVGWSRSRASGVLKQLQQSLKDLPWVSGIINHYLMPQLPFPRCDSKALQLANQQRGPTMTTTAIMARRENFSVGSCLDHRQNSLVTCGGGGGRMANSARYF